MSSFNNNTNSLKVRFIKTIPQSAGNNNTYGDCILITGEQNGIIDLGYDPSLTRLRYYITQDITPDPLTGKRNLDYIILTHYHEDHVTSNIQNALTTLTETSDPSLDLSNCTVYLPHREIIWDNMHFKKPSDLSNLASRETNCLNTLVGLVGAGKIGAAVNPVEGSIRSIGTGGNDKITFYNVDPSHYSTYYEYRGNSQNYHPTDPVAPPDTDYNAFSMMTILEHCGHKFVFPGDMSQPAQSYYYRLMRDCDVYKVEHHGLEYYTNDLWLNELKPKYAVICQFSDLSDVYSNIYFPRDDEFTYRKTVQHLAAKGTRIFSTYDSESVLIESTEDGLEVLTGETYSYPYGDVGFNTTYPYFYASRNLLTPKPGFEIVGGGFTRYGNMVIVQMMVRAKDAKAANDYWQIAAGFPRPFYVGAPKSYPQPETGTTANVAHYWHAPMQIIRYGNTTEHYTGWINPDNDTNKGILRVGVGSTNIPKDSTLYISGVYLARNGD